MLVQNIRYFTPLFLFCLFSVSCSAQSNSIQRESVSLVCVQKGEKYGFVDDLGVEIIPCEFDHPSTFSDEWVALKKGDNWAYYDANGNKILALKNRFTYCGDFHEGVAFVSSISSKGAVYPTKAYWKNISRELQYINKKGEVLFKIKNEWEYGYPSIDKEGFFDGWLKITMKPDPVKFERLISYLDKTGKLHLPFNFRDESNATETFSEGLADVGLRTYLPGEKKPVIKYGYINKDGNWQIPPIYTMVYPFKYGAAMVNDQMPNSNQPAFLIDTLGNRIFPLDVETFPLKIRDNLIAVSKAERSVETGYEIMGTRRYALAKLNGTMITDFIFGALTPGETSQDLWNASLPEDPNSIGYVNDQGEVVIPYQFGWQSSIFRNGLAIVKIKNDKSSQAVINIKGEYVIPPKPEANFQIMGGIILDNTKDGKKYNRNGQTIPLEGYTLRGPYQCLAKPGQ